jgi:predicted nucleic acid-binding Zn ribbon protein
VHFKGSGFYTTDYGRGSKRPKESKDSKEPSSDSGGEKTETKKAAEA